MFQMLVIENKQILKIWAILVETAYLTKLYGFLVGYSSYQILVRLCRRKTKMNDPLFKSITT